MAGRTTSAWRAVSVMTLLEHDGEEVVAAQAVQHAGLVGRDRRRVGVPADHGGDRRRERGVGQRAPELGHVDPPHRPRAQVGAAEPVLVDRPDGRRGDVRAAAAVVPPRAGERRQARDRAVGERRAHVALRADAEAQQRRLRGRERRARRGRSSRPAPRTPRRTARPGSRPGARAARRSRSRARGTTPRRAAPRRRSRASSRARAPRRCPGAGARARRPRARCGCGRDRRPRAWPPRAARRG